MKSKKQFLFIIVLASLLTNCSFRKFDQSHFSCLPSGAEALISIDLNKILSIPAVDRFIQEEVLTTPQQKIFRSIYTNLRKDTSRATLAFYRQSTISAENPIMAINMKFSRENLLKILDNEKVPYTTIKIGPDEAISISRSEEKKDLILFKKNNLILLAEENLNFYQQEMKKGGNVLQSPLLKKPLKRISPDKMLFFVAGSFTPLKEQAGSFQISLPSEAIAEIDYQQEKFFGMINLTAKDENDAQNIVNMLNGIKSLIIMGASEKNPQAASLIQKVNLSAQKDQIKIEFNFSISELESLKKMH